MAGRRCFLANQSTHGPLHKQLTPQGELDCYDLGTQLRERYMPTSESLQAELTTTIDGLTLWYDPDRVQVSVGDKSTDTRSAVLH